MVLDYFLELYEYSKFKIINDKNKFLEINKKN